MQYCDLDFKTMKEAVRLILDLEPKGNEQVDFVFSVKPDAPFDRLLANDVERKFNVVVLNGSRRDKGWPEGPNAQWYDTMMMAYGNKREGKNKWEYIFTTEPDIVPLEP